MKCVLTMENDEINAGKSPLIDEMDNDLEHLAVHQMADDNEANARHRMGHMLNYLRKAKEKRMSEMQQATVPPQATGNPQPTDNPRSDSMAGVDQLINSITQ